MFDLAVCEYRDYVGFFEPTFKVERHALLVVVKPLLRTIEDSQNKQVCSVPCVCATPFVWLLQSRHQWI